MTAKDVLQLIKDKDVKFVDLRFTDTRGKEQHVSVPIKAFGPEKFESGHFFDGSSIAGWKGIQASDMQGYERDPRSIAKRGEAYLKSTGLGDTAFFGPEPEFFIFDAVEWSSDMSGAHYKIYSQEAA